MFEKYLQKLESQKDLSPTEMEAAMQMILAGGIGEDDLVHFLTLLRDKSETAEEIQGAVMALKRQALQLPCKTVDVLDTCGTGGDEKNTFNISTATAFVVAGAGIPVAKHGNRAVSSKCGSADVLGALGVNVEASPETVARSVDQIGLGFLFAPVYHRALHHVAQARKKIGTKTIFNILGPLLNPAGAKKQVIGVYEERLLPLIATVLKNLGATDLAVVHGNDGLDELTLAATTKICRLHKNKIVFDTFDPHSVGYGFCRPADLRGGTAAENAARMKKMLKGHSQPIDHCVHLNAALAIQVYGRATDFTEALLMAQESVASGRAYEKLEALIEITNAE